MEARGHRAGRVFTQDSRALAPSWHGGQRATSGIKHHSSAERTAGRQRLNPIDATVRLPPLIHPSPAHTGTTSTHNSMPRQRVRATAVGSSSGAPHPSPGSNCISLSSLARGHDGHSRSPVSVVRRRSHALVSSSKHRRPEGGRRDGPTPMPVISLACGPQANGNTLIRPESISGGIGSPPNLTAPPGSNQVLLSTLPRQQRNRRSPANGVESRAHSPEPRHAPAMEPHATTAFRKILLRKNQCSTDRVLRRSHSQDRSKTSTLHSSSTVSSTPVGGSQELTGCAPSPHHGAQSITPTAMSITGHEMMPKNRITCLQPPPNPNSTRRTVRSADPTSDRTPEPNYASTLPALAVNPANIPVTSPPSTPTTPIGSFETGVVVVRQPNAIRSITTGIERHSGRKSIDTREAGPPDGASSPSHTPHRKLVTSRPEARGCHSARPASDALTVLAAPFSATAPSGAVHVPLPESLEGSRATSDGHQGSSSQPASPPPSPEMATPREAAVERVMVTMLRSTAADVHEPAAATERRAYASQHQLPGVFGKMLDDMLKERPHSAKVWMQKWFEDYAVSHHLVDATTS